MEAPAFWPTIIMARPICQCQILTMGLGGGIRRHMHPEVASPTVRETREVGIIKVLHSSSPAQAQTTQLILQFKKESSFP